jgi:hypothetical protein
MTESLQSLLQTRDSDWIKRNLLIHRNPREPDREALIELMINGLTPHLAAKELTNQGSSSRKFEGLRWLALEVEEQLYALLGSTLEGHLEELVRNGSSEILPSRARRLAAKAEANGMQVEIITQVRLI